MHLCSKCLRWAPHSFRDSANGRFLVEKGHGKSSGHTGKSRKSIKGLPDPVSSLGEGV